MDTMNIALPESMRRFVEERISAGGFGSVGEYVRELIRADQERSTAGRIDALLLEGLESGEPIPVIEDYWEAKKRGMTEGRGGAPVPP